MFQTILKNGTDVARYYGFLPPYGRELAAGAEIAIPAGVLAGSSVSDRRRQAALTEAIAAGHITVKESAAPVVFDAQASPAVSRVVSISNNTYGSVPPTAYARLLVTSAAVSGLTTGGTYQVLTTGGTPTAFAITGSAPAGVTINATTGLIEWSTGRTAGTYTATVQATNRAGSASGVITLTFATP